MSFFCSEVSLNGTTTSLQPPKRMETAQPKKITVLSGEFQLANS